MAPWKLRSLTLEAFVGYQLLEWDGIHPDLNLIVGQNGVGKSMLLEALVATLNFLDGRHARDALSRAFPDVAITVAFEGEHHARHFSTADIRANQGSRDTGWKCQILQVVENRQPKNQFGRPGPEHRQNPLQRYADVLARLQQLLHSNSDEDTMFVETVFDLCRCVPEVATSDEWTWIRREIGSRGPKKLRPVSCGQFDVLALMLDLATFSRDVRLAPSPHFVVFDNPETYLHSAALWPVLNLFREALPDGQVFIASHSPRLLLYPRHKSVFFLSRGARSEARSQLVRMDQLPRSGREAFFELYGEDVNSGLLSMLAELDSPTVHRFLCQCVDECGAKARKLVADDAQLGLAVSELDERGLVILDVGAGHGDLLAALISSDRNSASDMYFAYDPVPQSRLFERIREALRMSTIAVGSCVLRNLSEAPRKCDVAVLLNVCHHLRIPELAELISDLLKHRVDRRPGAGILIVELRTLAAGERNFILWTPEDFQRLFTKWPALRVKHSPRDGDYPEEGHEASLIRWNDSVSAAPSAPEIEEGLWSLLPEKREALLRELETSRSNPPALGLAEYWRQKRAGFLCAQITWLAMAEHSRHSKAQNSKAPKS